jgi:hypothetical protein
MTQLTCCKLRKAEYSPKAAFVKNKSGGGGLLTGLLTAPKPLPTFHGVNKQI